MKSKSQQPDTKSETKIDITTKPVVNYGVFSKVELQPGTVIPILGVQITEAVLDTMMSQINATHVWRYNLRRQPKLFVDGHPDSTGLNIAMMLNEPIKSAPNCIFDQDGLGCSCIRYPSGHELTVYRITWLVIFFNLKPGQ